MYYTVMKREKLRKILGNYYKDKDGKPTSMVNHIIRGIRLPKLEVVVDINKKYRVPCSAWLDIKSYLEKEEK